MRRSLDVANRPSQTPFFRVPFDPKTVSLSQLGRTYYVPNHPVSLKPEDVVQAEILLCDIFRFIPSMTRSSMKSAQTI